MAIFCVLSISFSAKALDPTKTISQYVHRLWTAEDGLPMNSVVTVTQTRDGYLWIGTGEGLMRFDGVRFNQINPKNAPVVRNYEIFSLYEDKSGVLWIGTTGGGVVRYQDEQYEVVNTSGGLKNNVVVDFAEDTNGGLWIATRGGGVNVLSDGEWQYYTTENGLLANVVNTILVDASGRKWIGTDHGISVIGTSGKVMESYTSDNGLVDSRVTVLFQDKDKDIWIGTEKGMNVLSGGVFESPSELQDFRITDILEDAHGNIWVGTYLDGLFVRHAGESKKFLMDEGASGLTEIHCLFEDQESNLWVGTGSFGLSFFSDGNVIAYTTVHGLKSDNIWGIAEDTDQTIWIGTGEGFHSWKDGKIEFFAGEEQGVSGYAYSMLETKKGEKWFSADGIGITRYDNGRFVFPKEEQKPANTHVRGFLEDSKGVLWMGTVKGGLYSLDGENLKNYTIEDGLPDMRISFIKEDKNGTLWLATDGGIGLIKDGVVSSITEADGLPINQVQIFYFDDEGNIWIGTYGGGLILLKDGKYYSATANDGLLNNAVYSILEDDYKNLWLCTNIGIVRISKEELFSFFSGESKTIHPALFGTDDGMKRNECNGGGQNPALKSSDGKLWFATIGGVAVVDPSKLIVQTDPPPVLVESVKVDGDEIKDGAVMLPGAERFEFQYTGFNYFAPKKLNFEHVIEGFDRFWVKTGTRRVAYYTHIPPGRYTFRVRACNKNGACNEEGASFSFSIKQKFTQTVTFWLLVVVAGFFAIGMLVLARVKQVRAREKEVSLLAWETTKKALKSQIDAIKKIAEDTSSISSNMGSMSSTLSTTSTGLETTVSHASVALEELERTGNLSQSNAKQVLESSATSAKFAEVGQLSVDRTKLVMKNVEDGSIEIVEKTKNLLNRLAEVDTIVSVVNSIADQSKVLAVNASIEAASAGEHGAGFAVVAKEISELAKQIKESTSTVSEMLTHSHDAIRDIVKAAERTRQETEDGVESVDRSEKTVSDLSDALQVNTNLARAIEAAVGEQKTGLKLISKEIQKVHKSASNNANISERVETESQRLNTFVTQLMKMIENWRTPDFYR